MVLPLFNGVSAVISENGRSVAENDNLKNEECETDKSESEHLTSTEGVLETLFLGDVATVCGLNVSGSSDHHTDVTSSHRGESTNPESNHGERSLGGSFVISRPWLVNSAQKYDTENEAENREIKVLFFEESDSALLNKSVDLYHLFKSGFGSTRKILGFGVFELDSG